MRNEFTYLRKYIILEKDYLNIPEINPKGHVKIETRGNKGNISIGIENCQLEEDYIISFLKDEKGQVKELNIGWIITDDRGRGRTNIPLNLRDLDFQGFSIGEINAILIRKGKDILLGAYIDKDTGTIERFIQEKIETDPVIEENIVEEIEDLEEIELDSESEPEPTAEIKLEPELEPMSEPEPEPIPEPIPEPQPTDTEPEFISYPEFEESQLKPEIESGLESELELEYESETVDSYQSTEYMRRLNHRNQMTNYILNILRFFPYVQPFKYDLHGYSWWQIEDDGTDSYKGFLPYFNYLMSTDYKYPFLNNSVTCFDQIKKYGHYLFGMYKEKGETLYYIYGIPGRFVMEEYPFRGVTGFNTWYESIEGMGYWLLYIDPMTGEIVHPINPMIPAY